jgi:hypothetical protein
MRAHTAGKAKGRYICPVAGGVFTHGLGRSIELAEPMRLVFQPGWDNNRYEADPDRPGWNRPVTYHRGEPDGIEQRYLDRAAGQVFGPGCVISWDFTPPRPEDSSHGKAGVYLIPAPDADPGTWFVSKPVTYKKCAACPAKLIASDQTRMDHEWVSGRQSYWRGSGWRLRRVEINQGPHPAGTYACRDCRPGAPAPAQPESDLPQEGGRTDNEPSREPPGLAETRPATREAGEPASRSGVGREASATDGDGPASGDDAVAALHDAMAVVSAVCDYARQDDGRGFNAADTWLGHVLAQMPAQAWTSEEALAGWDMLRKYRGQLASAGIDYDQLPRPAGADELEAERREEARERARLRAREHARQWRDQQYRQAHTYLRCDGEGEQVTLAFPYDPGLVDACRKIPGRRYDGAAKANAFPFTSLPAVIELAEAHGIEITADVRALAVMAATRTAGQEALPEIRLDEHDGTVVIDAPFNPGLNQALKDANGGRSTWDRAAKVHRLHVRAAGDLPALAERFGLRVSDQVRAAIAAETGQQDRNRAAAAVFEADPVPVPGLAAGMSLKPQQYPVVRFALEHRKVLVGDDMGWGKTASSLAAVAAGAAYPAVVVCRPSLTLNWAAEITRFFPALTVYQASGTTPQPVPPGTDVVIIGSAVLAAKPRQNDGGGGKEFGWVTALAAAGPKALIIDEGQDTKERAANRSQACQQLAAAVIAADGLVLDLTGTAILNRPRELCQQLTMLGRITEFGGPKAFLWRYCLSETNEWGASYNGARNLIELHDRLRSWGIMIRRSDDAALGLPPCREHVLRIPEGHLDQAVMARYRQAEADLLGYLAEQARKTAERLGEDPASAAVRAAMITSAAERAEHLVAINTLRQLAGQAKRGYVTEWVREQVAAGEKVMVAAHHRDRVNAYAAEFGGLKLQGGQSVEEKETAKSAFQELPAAIAPVIAVAIGAGGVGHTLTAARIGIQAEQAWTPGETQQMKKRLHRIGQDRPVDYYITVADGTIDEHLWQVVTAKQATLNAVLDGRSDEGAADDEASIAAELTWRLTQQGLGNPPPGTVPEPGEPGASQDEIAPSHATRADSGERRTPMGRAPAGSAVAASARAAVDHGSAARPVALRVLVTGSRAWTDEQVIADALREHWHDGTALLVTGACPRGADAIAERIWRSWGGLVERHPADWQTGRDAGMRRNAGMVALGADVCLAFIRDGSPGATHAAQLAGLAGIPVHRFLAGTGDNQAAGGNRRPSSQDSPATGTCAVCTTPMTIIEPGQVAHPLCEHDPTAAGPTTTRPTYGERDKVSERQWRQAHIDPDKVRAWCRDTGRDEPPARGALSPELVSEYLAERGTEDIAMPGGLSRAAWLAQRPVPGRTFTVRLGWRNGPSDPFTVVYGPCPRCGAQTSALPGQPLPPCLDCASHPPGDGDPALLAGPGGHPVAGTPLAVARGNDQPGGPVPPTGRTDDDEEEDEAPAQARITGQQLRDAAHRYLDQGLWPVPAWGITQQGGCCCWRGAECPRPGKHPRSVRTGPGQWSWQPLACRDHGEVDRRFAPGSEYATGNLMVAIPPGMMAIDRDDDDGGQAALAVLAGELGELPPTLAHRTPHGEHLIYATPPGWQGRAWVGKDPGNPVPAGIDLRMPGQILMAPPSVVPTPDGPARYGPTSGAGVTALPAAYVAAWTPPQPPPQPAAARAPVPADGADRAAKYVHDAMARIAGDLASREGARNSAAYTAGLKAGSLLGAVRITPGAETAAGAWTDEAAEEALLEAARANGYVGKDGEAEARRAIQSGLRNGLRGPRALPDFTPSGPAPAASHRARPAVPGPAQPPRRPAPGVPLPRRGRWQDMVPAEIRREIEAADQAASARRRTANAAYQQALARHGQSGGAPEADAELQRRQAEADAAYRAYTQDGRHVTGRHDAAMLRWAASIAAQRDQQATGTGASPHDSPRMQANRAAIAANEAYRAGDLDQAGRLADQAAVLDPSRAGLWQQHQQQIAARRLIYGARAAHAEGDHQRAHELLEDARQLDPRMPALWDGDLPALSPARPDAQARSRDVAASGPSGAAGNGRSPATDTGRGDHVPMALAQAGREAPQPPWPGSPPRRQLHDTPPDAPGQTGRTQRSAPRPAAAAPREPRAHPGTTGREADADAEADGDPAARWPAPNPRVPSRADPPGQQARHEVPAGQQPGHCEQISPAPQTEPGRTADADGPGAPSADWRDDVLSRARQPWQPAPSWPGNPALHRPAEPGTPDAGIEPGEPDPSVD